MKILQILMLTAACGMSGSPAYAENWVQIYNDPSGDPSFLSVDVDSIRKEADGLVHYTVEEDMGASPTAINCQQKLYYVIGDGTLDKTPYPIKPGSTEALEADFVCSRV